MSEKAPMQSQLLPDPVAKDNSIELVIQVLQQIQSSKLQSMPYAYMLLHAWRTNRQRNVILHKE